MSEVETNICQDCGKSKGNKGSITQWIGLGEQCHCNLQQAAQSMAPGRTKANQCRRCLKAKPTAQQSMTQWLFKKDRCNCPKEKQTVEPFRIDLPSTSPTATSTKFNKWIMSGTIGLISLIAIGYSCMVLEVPNVFDSKYSLSHKSGKDRMIQCSPDVQIPFNTAAISVINKGEYADLTLKDSLIDDIELNQLGGISSLEGLTLQHCGGFTPRGLAKLVRYGNLKRLSLINSPLSQMDLEALVESQVETLDLSHTAISNADWTCLTNIDSLKRLVLHDVFVTIKNRQVLENARFHGDAGVFIR